MSRSNAPLALSVVKVTIPGDVQATARRMNAFDQAGFGFNHDDTWKAMPPALTGMLNPAAVANSLAGKHPRVAKCIEALCRLGTELKLNTRAFADFPQSGIRPVTAINWGPDISVRAKATCWYVNTEGLPVIPLLQPRKEAYSSEQLGVYAGISRQAFCNGDWSDADVCIVDLSGDDKDGVNAKILMSGDLPITSQDLIASYVKTYVAAKRLVENVRQKPIKPKDSRISDLFDSR